MNRFVVMVDAGYLLRQAIELVSHKASSSRSELTIPDPSALIAVLLQKSRATLDLVDKELLRVYWYDGVMANGFTAQQRSIVDVDDVQFRAGTINRGGQQKGVDSLIVTDLIELTTHHAICDAILITGDSDLAVGIEIAQRRGVRIAVLGIEDLAAGVSHHQSFEITSRADRVGRLGSTELGPVLQYTPAPAAPTAQTSNSSAGAAAATPTASTPAAKRAPNNQLSTADKSQITSAVKSFIAAQQGAPLSGAVDPSTKRIDAAVDRALLHHLFTALGRKLTPQESVFIREVFRAEV